MNPRPPSFSGRARQEWLLLGAVLLAVGLFGLWSRHLEHREIDAAQRHLLGVQARGVDEALTGQLAAIGVTLRGVRDAHARTARDPGADRLPAVLQTVADALAGVAAMSLVDRGGRVLASTDTAQVGRAFGDAEVLKAARGRVGQQALLVSSAFATPSGDHTVHLSLPLSDAAGEFDGFVSATLDPDHVRAVLHATLYAEDVWAAAGHADGTLLVMEPRRAGLSGFRLDQPGSFFRRHRDSGQAATVMMAQRTLAAAEVGLDRPLVIAVGRNLDAMFMPWWRQNMIVGLLYGLLVACTSLALVAMQRRQRALEALHAQQEAAARQSAGRLELALRGADLGLWDLDLRTGKSHVSERWNSMLGLPHQPVYPDSECWTSRVHPDDFPRVWAAQEAHLQGRTERFDEAYRMRHADGHWIWVLDRAQVLERAPDGAPLRMVGTHMDTTEAMETRLAIERSEQNLSTTLHSIGDAVIATDPEGTVVRINAAAQRLTGWSAAEALGRPLGDVFRIFHSHTRAPSVDPVQQVLARGEVVGLANDTLLVARDGSEYQIADSAAPIRGQDGVISGVVLVFSDVSERYRSEQALRANQAWLRSLLDHLGSGVMVYDSTIRIVDVNPSACQLLGASREQLIGKAPADHRVSLLEADGSVMPLARMPVPQVLATNQPVKDMEVGVPRKAPAGLIWALANAYPMRNPQGGIEQIVVTFSDITARKQAEQNILAAQSELKATLDAIPDLMFELGLDGTYHGFHSPRHDLIPPTGGGLIGRKVADVLPAAATAVVMEALAQADAVGRSVGLQYELTLPRGTCWFELSAARKPGPAGEAARFIVLARDITERIQAERERQGLEAQLREAQKMESIGTLAGGIAHDFNNILAAILGNAAMAREDLPGDHPVTASLDQIQRAGLRARQLVQQILSFSRRDLRGLTTQPLGPIVDETLDLLRATLPAGVRIDAVRPQQPLLVRGDSTQLQQVLVNLCTNAWHALPERGGRIEVGSEACACDEALRQRLPELKPGRCTHLWVRDNGCGMDEATRQRIFDPFFTTKPIGRGTGLGLSVVHGIVRAHEGLIAVDTAPGAGTTVHLYLPIPEPEPAHDLRAGPAATAPCGAGQHVLYIDDDEVMAVTIERLLQRTGFVVTVDTDAAAAVERVRQAPAAYDAVVTDFNMPELSGIDVARQLARIRPDLPVVISSGHLSDELRARAADAGVRHLMQKENSFEELGGLLLRLFAARTG